LQIIGSFELHQDNALAPAALSVREFLGIKHNPMLPQAPYSPDLSLYDFCLFPKLKSRVKGYHLQTLDSVQKAVTDAIKTLTEAGFQASYEAWKIRWVNCVASEGYYFEGDNVYSDE
jgi:transposase